MIEEPKKNTRRRGEILEEAIIQATREELSATGYAHMTMESIATRAGTNKAVLYRRWANKSDLVLAVLRKNMPQITNVIPDTGDLRNDLFTYLHSLAQPIQSIGVQTIRGLMMEPSVWNKILAVLPKTLQPKPENKIITAFLSILKHAELREEVQLEQISPRILSLPWDLLRMELATKQELTDAAIAEILDDIFLPLVRLHSHSTDPA